jgi:hypothetical protein
MPSVEVTAHRPTTYVRPSPITPMVFTGSTDTGAAPRQTSQPKFSHTLYVLCYYLHVLCATRLLKRDIS